MFINAVRFVHNAPVARLYYAVRALDRCGQGWIEVPHNKLNRKLSASESTVRRLLNQGQKLGWLSFQRRGGMTYVKYGSDRKFARKHGEEKGTINQSLLKQPAALAARVTQVRVIHEQYRVEQKLHRAIWTTSIQWKPILDQLDERIAQAQVCHNSDKLQANVFVDRGTYTVGLTQVELAKRLNLPLDTLKQHLQSAPKVVPYKEVSAREAIETDAFVICDEDIGRFYRRMPNYYVDHYTPKAVKTRKLKLRFDGLDPQVIEIAKLMGVSMGFHHSRTGAIKAINRMGFARFWKNLDPILRETPAGKKREAANSERFRKKLEQGAVGAKSPHKESEPIKPSVLQRQTANFFGIDLESA